MILPHKFAVNKYILHCTSIRNKLARMDYNNNRNKKKVAFPLPTYHIVSCNMTCKRGCNFPSTYYIDGKINEPRITLPDLQFVTSHMLSGRKYPIMPITSFLTGITNLWHLIA